MLNEITPLKFEPGILTFYILSLVLYLVIFIFTYSYYQNAYMKVYNKLHYRLLTYFLLLLVVFLLLISAITITILHYDKTNDLFLNNIYMIPLSWILVTLAISHLILMIVIKFIANKNKKDISHFRNENFQKLLETLEQKCPNEIYLTRFKNKHPRYFSNLEQHEKIISSSIENYHKENYEQTLLNIIVFNDNYTTHWLPRNNYFQLKIFYELCIKLQKKLK